MTHDASPVAGRALAGTTTERSRLDAWLSPNPAKAATERWYLLYTPIWGAIAGFVMVSGVTRHMGDAAYLVFGVGLWLGVLLPPFVRPSAADRGAGTPWHARFHTKFQAWMFVFAFLGNYRTDWFYDVLGMQYGFPTHWNLNNVPFFLYPLTVCYFTTYATLIDIGLRGVRRRLVGRPPWLHHAAIVPVCLAMAFGETLFNANPFIDHLFCYEDLRLMLWFGTLVYGTWFVIAAPFWSVIDEEAAGATPWRDVWLGSLAAFMVLTLAMDFTRDVIAPQLTTVVHGADGLGNDPATTCLTSP